MKQGVVIAGMLLFGAAVSGTILFIMTGSEQLDETLANSSQHIQVEQVVQGTLQARTQSLQNDASLPDKDNKQLEQDILATIDRIAHPGDPQNPPSVQGISDEKIIEYDSDEIRELIIMALPVAESHLDKPRYLFALGRAEWLHGDDNKAYGLLTKAAEFGSSAAFAYLARITDDYVQGRTYLQEAVKGGFGPAYDWLAQVEDAISQEQAEIKLAAQQQQEKKFDFERFVFPEVIKDLYNGNTQHYMSEPLLIIKYIKAINDAMTDQGVLIYLDNPKAYLTEIDPSLSFEIDKKLMTNQDVINQATTAGMKMWMGMVVAVAESRKNNASITQEIAAVNNAIFYGGQQGRNSGGATYVTIYEMEEDGNRDGKILALEYDKNPEVFRKIYQGMRKFIRHQL